MSYWLNNIFLYIKNSTPPPFCAQRPGFLIISQFNIINFWLPWWSPAHDVMCTQTLAHTGERLSILLSSEVNLFFAINEILSLLPISVLPHYWGNPFLRFLSVRPEEPVWNCDWWLFCYGFVYSFVPQHSYWSLCLRSLLGLVQVASQQTI